MEINLRKANAVQAEIRKAVNANSVENTLSVSEFTQDLTNEIVNAKDAYVANINRKVALTIALYNIRKSVAEANATAGINGILTDVQRIEAVMAVYSTVANQPVSKTLQEIEARLEKIKTAPADARSAIYGDRYNNVETSVVEQATVDAAKAKVKDLKRERQNLQDKLLALNVNSLITVSAADEATLKAEGIL
jgi:polyhydroxyalkanoate synthesis regulator phasin